MAWGGVVAEGREGKNVAACEFFFFLGGGEGRGGVWEDSHPEGVLGGKVLKRDLARAGEMDLDRRVLLAKVGEGEEGLLHLLLAPPDMKGSDPCEDQVACWDKGRRVGER
jgi:hypothetical protein